VDVYIAHDWNDYAISKNAAVSSAGVGSVVEFSVTIRNVDDEGVGTHSLELVDTFDSSLAVVESAPGGQIGEGRISWLLDGFAADSGPRVLRYSLRLRDDAPIGSVLRNVARLGVLGGSGDIAPQDNVSSASVAVTEADDAAQDGDGVESVQPPSADSPDVPAPAGSNTDSAASAAEQAGEPFLPFTGGVPASGLLVAWLCATLGICCRFAAARI
jgi:hypothetical protein